MHRRAQRLAIAAAVWGALAGGLTACASGTESPSTTTPPQVHGAYDQCLSDNGVSSPTQGPPPGPAPSDTPSGPPPGVDQSTWDRATAACASLKPSAPGPTGR